MLASLSITFFSNRKHHKTFKMNEITQQYSRSKTNITI